MILGVRILDIPYHADRIYEYCVRPDDEALWRGISPGRLAMVPFGAGNRGLAAVVLSVREGNGEEPMRLKAAIAPIHEELKLSKEMLKLCDFMVEHTFCSFGDAVKSILPVTNFGKLSEGYRALSYEGELSEKEALFLSLMREEMPAQALFEAALAAGIGLGESKSLLAALLRAGAAEKVLSFSERRNRSYLTYCAIGDNAEVDAYLCGEKKLRSAAQLSILTALRESGESEMGALTKELHVTTAQVRALVQKGLVTTREVERLRLPFSQEVAVPKQSPPPPLSAEQKAAVETLFAMLDTKQPRAALLYGVTGSGKTHVIRAAADHAIKLGRQVIILVPEIALTPQTVGFFLAAFGSRIAVWHSALSAGEKLDAWRRMRRGDADICIGTRSAIFAPFDNVGLIVMDEEQEHTYKSDMTPKYHARDIARYRCGVSGATMLLASATPSLESFYKAKSGAYTLIELRDRYGDATLPTVRFADLRRDAAAGSFASVGSEMAAAIAEAKQAGKQSILFINRRGYHNFLSCPICGEVKKCPHCSVAMTYHRYRAAGGAESGYLACHYCGMREPTPKTCPSCGNPKMRYMGYGTQKVEEELKERFPSLRVLRMDADTTQTKSASDRLLGAFRAGQADLLLGTQMVTKGHDFGNVTLVGVLNADTSLYLEDYRANERTFSLITQVVGRAGRGEHAGQALIQSYNPEHPTLQLAAAQDYGAFYDSEIRLRRTLVFPPFCDMIMVTVSDTDEVLTQRAALAFDEAWRRLAGEKGVKMVLFGPFEAPVYKVNDRYRMRIVVKCKDNKACRDVIRELLCSFAAKERKGQANPYKKVQFTVDINPTGL